MTTRQPKQVLFSSEGEQDLRGPADPSGAERKLDGGGAADQDLHGEQRGDPAAAGQGSPTAVDECIVFVIW